MTNNTLVIPKTGKVLCEITLDDDSSGDNNQDHRANQETEESFMPKINQTWSVNSTLTVPNPVFTKYQNPDVNGVSPPGSFVTRLQDQEPSDSQITVKVPLPSRQTMIDHGVHEMELRLQYADGEECILKMDLRSNVDLPNGQNQESDIPMTIVGGNDDYCSPPIIGHTEFQEISQTDTFPTEVNHHSFHENEIFAHAMKTHERGDDVVVLKSKNGKFAKEKKPTQKNNRITDHQNRSFYNLFAAIKLYHCPQCKKSFTEKDDFNKHLESDHLPCLEKRVYNCPQCDKQFVHKSLMIRHYQSVHLGIRHNCQNCGKRFVNLWQLQRHRNKCHP